MREGSEVIVQQHVAAAGWDGINGILLCLAVMLVVVAVVVDPSMPARCSWGFWGENRYESSVLHEHFVGCGRCTLPEQDAPSCRVAPEPSPLPALVGSAVPVT